MRRLLLLIAVAFLWATAGAQGRIKMNFNVDLQPGWGPTGYDHVEYYYLPDIGVYYSVPQQKFIYSQEGVWVIGSGLPWRYRGYDLYQSYKVVLNEPIPYRKSIMHRAQYASVKGRHQQRSIRDSRDPKYFINKDHPEHENWVKQQAQNNENVHGNTADGGNR